MDGAKGTGGGIGGAGVITDGEGAEGVGTESKCRKCGCGMLGMDGDGTTYWGGICCGGAGIGGGMSCTLSTAVSEELQFFMGGIRISAEEVVPSKK